MDQLNSVIENVEPIHSINPCRCGSFTHKRTNSSECILNKANIHKLSAEKIIELENAYKANSKINMKDGIYFEIAKRVYFSYIYLY
jgi:hypothetical protein